MSSAERLAAACEKPWWKSVREAYPPSPFVLILQAAGWRLEGFGVENVLYENGVGKRVSGVFPPPTRPTGSRLCLFSERETDYGN